MTTLFHIVDYRGATIEDLDIRPALLINPFTPLNRAIEVSFENEFSYLPVIHEENKRLLGVLNVEELTRNSEKLKAAGPKATTFDHMLWFSQSAKARYSSKESTKSTPLNSKILKPRAGTKYTVLTPLTPLEDLAAFFNKGSYFAIITNGEGNLVYGVVTPGDLIKYEHARPRL